MTQVAIIAIIVENKQSVEALNLLLHNYAEDIIGRMGLPYRQKAMNIISIVLDAPQEKIAALSDALAKLPGVNVSTVYAKQ